MIIVTSGHVDHGKTALLQALTGTHTAHLPEEKRRGMTIDLGYAYLPVGDHILGFIDVPGHEKFLANMLAGLGGVHYAMLIVAADEGVQAQTEEHLAILRQLQFTQILVVITKSDRANTSQIAQLTQQIKVSHPFLAQSPFFVTSAANGQGIAELRHFLTELPNLNDIDKPFRYAIDRIFSVKGAGTVVTGTAFSGKVKINDELYLSNGEKVRIKAIHAQNSPAEQGVAGQRLALNIHTDSDRSAISRGDWLFTSMPPQPTDRISVLLTAESALDETQAVHIYHAASRTTGKLSLLSTKNCIKNQQVLAEVILDQPLFLAFGDKLVLRSGDNKHLVAGAKVLETHSPKRHKRTEERLNLLENLNGSKDIAERIALYLADKAVPVADILWAEQLSERQFNQLIAQEDYCCFQEWCFNADYQQAKTQQILTTLWQYHHQNPDQIGLGKARLYRMATVNQPERLMFYFIELLLEQGKLQQDRGFLHLPEHKIYFSEKEQVLWQLVLSEFAKQQGQACWVRDIANSLQIDEAQMRQFLYKAGKLGYLIPIVRDRFFLSEDVYSYAKKIRDLIEKQGEISVNQLRDELSFGRKLTVQLIEYFDHSGFLRRKGDVHILRDRNMFK